MARAYARGHLVEYDWDKKIWVYADTGEIINDKRICKKCGKQPTKEGYDYCLGYLRDAKHACCGHGIKEGYVINA